jgi:hypothetical protein
VAEPGHGLPGAHELDDTHDKAFGRRVALTTNGYLLLFRLPFLHAH